MRKPDAEFIASELALALARASELATAAARELTQAFGEFYKCLTPPPKLSLAEDAAVHGGFHGIVRLLGSVASVPLDGFAHTLMLYTKSLRDRQLIEQDPQLCIVVAQRAEESAQWRGVVSPRTEHRKRNNKKKKRFG